MKAELRKHGVCTGTLANYLGLSYPYVSNMINGTFRMPEKHELKIRKLLSALEQEV